MRSPLIVLLRATTFANTCSIGAVPSLLPEIARETALPDWQIGLFAGAFGFARMVADLPAGVFIARLAGGLIAGPIVIAAGTLTLASADGFTTLFTGRALMGVGHALNMLAALTAILQAAAARRLSVALNAFEFSAMIGLLCGAGLVATLPRALTWKAVLLTACAPQVRILAGVVFALAVGSLLIGFAPLAGVAVGGGLVANRRLAVVAVVLAIIGVGLLRVDRGRR